MKKAKHDRPIEAEQSLRGFIARLRMMLSLFRKK